MNPYNYYFDGLVQERPNSSALYLYLSCINPSIWKCCLQNSGHFVEASMC